MTVVFLTAGTTTWSVPAGVTSVFVECLGSGGAGFNRQSSSVGGCAGAGGAYAADTVSVTPLDVITVAIGAAGGTTLTNFGGFVIADYGRTATLTVAGVGGAVANCAGATKFAGGDGRKPASGGPGGGAGGAAGPHGAGTSATTQAGGAGDNGNTTGGAINTAGVNGTQWDASHGSGSGAGGASVNGSGNAGKAGGSFGAGGSGASSDSAGSAGGAGSPGLIVLTYTVSTADNPPLGWSNGASAAIVSTWVEEEPLPIVARNLTPPSGPATPDNPPAPTPFNPVLFFVDEDMPPWQPRLMVPPSAAPPPQSWTFIQGITGSFYGGSNVSTFAQAFAAPVTPGSHVIATITWDTTTGADVSGAADDLLNVLTPGAAALVDAPHSQNAAVYYLKRAPNAPQTVTFSLTAATTFMQITLAEVAGLGDFDGCTGQIYNSGDLSPDAVSSGAIVTQGDGDFVYGVAALLGGTLAHGTGFADGSIGSNLQDEYIYQATHGSIAATFTSGTNNDRLAFVLAFKTFVAADTPPSLGASLESPDIAAWFVEDELLPVPARPVPASGPTPDAPPLLPSWLDPIFFGTWIDPDPDPILARNLTPPDTPIVPDAPPGAPLVAIVNLVVSTWPDEETLPILARNLTPPDGPIIPDAPPGPGTAALLGIIVSTWPDEEALPELPELAAPPSAPVVTPDAPPASPYDVLPFFPIDDDPLPTLPRNLVPPISGPSTVFGYVSASSGMSADGTTALASTVSVTLPAVIPPGGYALITVVWGSTGARTLLGVQDDKLNVYGSGQNGTDTTRNAATYYLGPINNSPQTLTATFSGACDFRRIAVDVFTGLLGSSSDGSAWSLNTSGSTVADALDSGTVTTTADLDLIWGATATTNATIGAATGTGFITGQQSNQSDNCCIETEYRIQPHLGPASASFTNAGASRQITHVIAFKTTSVPGPDPAPLALPESLLFAWPDDDPLPILGRRLVPPVSGPIATDPPRHSVWNDALQLAWADLSEEPPQLPRHGIPVSGPASSARIPFGSHYQGFTPGFIVPNNVTQAERDASTAAFWSDYKTAYFVTTGVIGHYIAGGQSAPIVATSEGQGYGMVMAAHMDDQTVFDAIYAFGRAHPSVTSPYLMSWKVADDGSMPDPTPALDGDIDMTYGLLLADKQWGSDGPINYLAEALNNIAAVKSVYVLSNFTLSGSGTTARSSDQMPAMFKSFYIATSDPTWISVTDRLYAMVSYLQANYAPATGLLPDWIASVTSTNVAPANASTPSTDAGAFNGLYDYNACRDPIRLAIDWLLTGDTRSNTAVDKMTAFWRTQSSNGADLTQICPSTLAGVASRGNYTDGAFIGPAGAACMTNPANQTMLNNIWAYLISRGINGYFSDSWAMQSMIVISQNWITPTTPVPAPNRVQGKVSLDTDANATPITQYTLTFDAPLSDQALVVGGFTFDSSTATINRIQDDIGNTYALIDFIDDVGHGQGVASFWKARIPGGAQALTVYFNSSTTFFRMAMTEFAGYGDLFGHAAALNTSLSTSQDAMTSGVFTPYPGSLIWGIGAQTSGSGGLESGTGFGTADGGLITDTVAILTEALVQPTADPVAATFSAVHGFRLSVLAAGFKPLTALPSSSLALDVDTLASVLDAWVLPVEDDLLPPFPARLTPPVSGPAVVLQPVKLATWLDAVQDAWIDPDPDPIVARNLDPPIAGPVTSPYLPPSRSQLLAILDTCWLPDDPMPTRPVVLATPASAPSPGQPPYINGTTIPDTVLAWWNEDPDPLDLTVLRGRVYTAPPPQSPMRVGPLVVRPEILLWRDEDCMPPAPRLLFFSGPSSHQDHPPDPPTAPEILLRVLSQGYKETMPNLIKRTPMDVGPAKIRRRFSVGTRPLTISIELSNTEVATIENFHTIDLEGGSLRFQMQNPRTLATAYFRFTKPPEFVHIGGHYYRASLTLEMMP
jgi:endo-1,4-beta-D-glucanase Y